MDTTFVFLCITLVRGIVADMYLHNPRGSNNRLDEQGRARNNGNRLFDSQNNNRGGYNVGSLYYYVGSKLQIEWTNQHSCGDSNNHCEVVLQYMCGDMLRDGATTTTIPDNPLLCEGMDCTSDKRYGMHEDYWYYLDCRQRQRNMGLFTADQRVLALPRVEQARGQYRAALAAAQRPRQRKRLSNRLQKTIARIKNTYRKLLRGRVKAINTRQNPGGTRRGYECPEERDYYPYWHPSPWKDIAVLTKDATRCPYYQAESGNVKSRWACEVPRWYMLQKRNDRSFLIPNTKEECEKLVIPGKTAAKAVWKEYPAHGLPAPACRETDFSRDNHLGNGLGGQPLTFNWTIPDDVNEKCAIRARYNISTADYAGWGPEAANYSHSKAPWRRGQGVRQDHVDVGLGKRLGFPSEAAARARGFQFKNNPVVELFPGQKKFQLRLAVNTAQYGRTFQDRSHLFAIRSRPAALNDVTIHNLNVRGKRGNIVQVYPGVEYDFVPNTLEMALNDYVHIQWTGSNTNPHNNDSQGRAGTDRSNIVLQRAQVYPDGGGAPFPLLPTHGHWARNYPDVISNVTFLGLGKGDLQSLAFLSPGQFGGEMSELDDAGTYFDLGPRKVTMAGVFYYMSTRNNNFSNRSQKGRIIVRDVAVSEESVGWNGGSLASPRGTASVSVDRGVFTKLHKLRMEEWSKEQGQAVITLKRAKQPPHPEVSPYVALKPEGELASGDGGQMEMKISTENKGLATYVVYRTNEDFTTWSRVQAQVADGTASFSTRHGGVYVVVAESRGAVIAGTVVAVLAVLALVVGGLVLYFKRNPLRLAAVRRTLAARI